MSIVDDRGRLAGRVNLLDALIAVLLLVFVPVAYGAYLLFRTPPARVTGISPTTLYQGSNQRITITGVNLRPFMRVSFSTIQGRTFLIGSTTSAQVDLPDLGPGIYDVQLFDYMQMVDQLPKALTILPMAAVPSIEMEVTGAFTGVTADIISRIQPGMKFPPSGQSLAQVIDVGAPTPGHVRVRAGDDVIDVPLIGQQELPATLRVTCGLTYDHDGGLRCLVSGPTQPATVAPDSVLTLKGPDGWLNFQIKSARGPSSSQR